MTLNWPYFFSANINVLIWVSTVYLFLNYSNLTLNWYDLYARVLENEFYLNIYYFMWTSFWYIPFFILLILVWQLNKFMYIRPNFIQLILILTFALALTDLHNYWSLNTYPYSLTLKSEHFNNLLVNSINKYHPGFLYISSINIITYWFTLNYTLIQNDLRFSGYYLYYIWKKSATWFSLLLYYTLGLGSWWALQEGSWGGWWNWDPSEVFGLIILMFYISYLHFSYSKQNFINHIIHNQLFFLVLLQIYFFTQLNFDLVSHNFGTKIDNFIDNTNLYALIIVLSCFYVKHVCRTSTQVYLFKIHNPFGFIPVTVSNFKLYGYVVVTILSYELLYSLIPLINDFLWKLSGLNISNYIISFEKLNLQLYILLLIFFWNWSVYAVFLVSISLTTNLDRFLSLLNVKYLNTLLFHVLLGVFVILSLSSTSYINIIWSLPSTLTSSNITSGTTFMTQNMISINNLSLDISFNSYLLGNFMSTWNTIWLDTTLEVYSFIYILTQDLTTQVMFIGSNLFVFTIQVNDVLSCNLLNTVAVASFVYIYIFYRYIRIIF